MAGGFDGGRDLSFQFDRHEGIKCYAIVSGEGWLRVEGVPDPVHLEAGYRILLPRGLPFCLATDLSLTPVDAYTLLATARTIGVTVINGGGTCFVVGGYFTLSGKHADIPLSMLPPIVHIRNESRPSSRCKRK